MSAILASFGYEAFNLDLDSHDITCRRGAQRELSRRGVNKMGVVDGARGREEGMQRQRSHRSFAIDSKRVSHKERRQSRILGVKPGTGGFMRGKIDRRLVVLLVFSISL